VDPNEIVQVYLTRYKKNFPDKTKFLSVASFYSAINMPEAMITFGASVNCHDNHTR
jgi:hypothetical protein